MKNIPWEEIRKRYESEKVSYQQLGEAYGISYKTVGEHARKEKWTKGRQLPIVTENCVSSTMRQLARRLALAENGEEVNLGEIKELTAVLRDLMKVKELIEKTDAEETTCVRVELSEEVEAWSK